MRSKLLAGAAIAAAVLTFTGCSGKNDVSKVSPEVETQSEITDTLPRDESIEAYDGTGNEGETGIISDVADGLGEAATMITDGVSEGMTKTGDVLEDTAEGISSVIDMR